MDFVDQSFLDQINSQAKHPLDTIKDYNFVSSNTSLWMFRQMFDPIESGERYILLQPTWNMAHLIHASGVFDSIGNARKNGWNKPIPKGLTNFIVGKKKISLWIFIPLVEEEAISNEA
jgi:hypothetical protein